MEDALNIQPGLSPAASDDVSRAGLLLLLGPPNSGKLGGLLEWWRERLPLDSVVVVPTGPDAHETTREMVGRVGSLVGHLPAVTFDRLMAEVLGERPRYATSFERHLILRGIVERAGLPALGSMTVFPGTVDALAGLLDRLDESGRPLDQILGAFASWGRVDPNGPGLADDLATVIGLFHRAIEDAGLTDRPGAVRSAARQLEGWCRPVAFYGFTSFTPGQAEFVEALATRVPVAMALSYDDSRSVNMVDRNEVARWRARADRVVTSTSRTQAYSSPAIAFLERHVLDAGVHAQPPEAASGPEGVRFLLASGQRNEAESAAQHIAALIRAGFQPGRIGVVVRRVEAWSSLLAQVFASCDIPFRLDRGRQFRGSGLGHAFLSALEGLASDDAAALLRFLRSPYSGAEPAAVSEAETVYRRGFARGVRPLMDVLDDESSPVLAFLTGVVDGRGESARLRIEGLDSFARAMLAAGLCGVDLVSREAEEDIKAYGVLRGALESARQLSQATGETEWLDARIFLPAMGTLVVPGGPVEGQDAVQVLSPYRTRARRFDALFVLGLVEGEFPARIDKPSLLTEGQAAQVDALAGGGLLPPRNDSEAALFANVISRAWQVLYLSARDADDGGGEAVPSQFWLRSKEILRPSGAADHHRGLADQVFRPDDAPSLRHYRRACAYRDRLRWVEPGESVGSAGVTRWDRGEPVLRDPGILADLASRESFSPSELESYLACPFTWFMRRVLGAEQMDAELDEQEFGRILHSGLSAAYRRMALRGVLPVRPETLDEAIRIVSGVVDGLLSDGSCPGSAADRRIAAWRLMHATTALLKTECAGGGHLSPAETELAVGGDTGVDVGGLKLRGRIDRVDADPAGNRLFVIDYKTKSIPSASAIGTDKGLQLPLYLLALGAERSRERVVGGAYFSVAERRYSGVVSADAVDSIGAVAEGCRSLDVEQEAELFRTTVETALRAVDGIRKGVIAPQRERDCPPWCDYGPVCRSKAGGYRR